MLQRSCNCSRALRIDIVLQLRCSLKLKNSMLNKTIKDILVGVLLGDAHVGRSGLDKAFISFEQSKSKIEYLNYLHK